MDPLGFITIRGVDVDIHAKKINNFYFRKDGESKDEFSLKYTDYDERIKNMDDHRVWAASVIAKETPDWIDPPISIHKNTLKNEAKFWLSIICSRVLPSFNDTNIGLEKAIMIACLMSELGINVEEIIQDEIQDWCAPAISVATFSAPTVELGIPAHGMRLIRITESKVTHLVKKFHDYVKEGIETALAPYKENLEAVRKEQKSIRHNFRLLIPD
ncbi:hypothetical protein RND71_022021 [Anisodus tanguticus]|uniref:Putative plant transposon protein domain-containing protein n=1 Tax=Anisodus tanguticus TaxID=243964 RepID=A0AAE1RZ93_9SOLA|nr:hypothetical protein RND71_022021 [Anisodus tanguticus]